MKKFYLFLMILGVLSFSVAALADMTGVRLKSCNGAKLDRGKSDNAKPTRITGDGFKLDLAGVGGKEFGKRTTKGVESVVLAAARGVRTKSNNAKPECSGGLKPKASDGFKILLASDCHRTGKGSEA